MSHVKTILINLIFIFILFSLVLYINSTLKTSRTSSYEKPNPALFYQAPLDEALPSKLYRPIKSDHVHFKIQDHTKDGKYAANYIESYLKNPGSFRSVARVAGVKAPIYDVVYVLNKNGVRKVEPIRSKKFSKKFIAAFGDSQTFGEGLPQGEDYPSQLQKKLPPSWNTYNFGFHGYGPNSIIYNISKNSPYKKIVEEPSGVFVWLFIPDHMTRFFCYFDCYTPQNNWALQQLREVRKDGSSFVALNSFQSSGSTWRKSLFFASQFLDLSILGSFKYNEKHYSLFIDALNFIALNTSANIEKKIFIFDGHSSNIDRNGFAGLLVRNGFIVVDLQSYLHLVPAGQHSIAGDGHNSAAKNWVISSVLKKIVLGY